jgi:McrBC 5-methylcytosine restriction system component
MAMADPVRTPVHPVAGDIRLHPSTLTLNPDLVFEDEEGAFAVGDVKYKLASSEWRRADLYQAAAFAAGFRVSRAAVIAFQTENGGNLPSVKVGDFEIRHFTWDAHADTAPEEAASQLINNIVSWIGMSSPG